MATAHLVRNPTKGKWKNLIGTNAIAFNSVTIDELAVDLQDRIDQIDVNKDNIQAIIDSKGVASGIATLGADGKLLAAQIPQIAISDFLGEVANEAAMLAKTGQRGDWLIRTDVSKTYMLIGDDASVLANWKEIVSPTDGVTALRNVSGSVTGMTGVVTLANVAFTGSANDVSFADASYTSTNVKGALVEVMGKVTDVESSVTTLETTIGNKIGLAQIEPYVSLTGMCNGTNKVFTAPFDLTGAKVIARIGGETVDPTEYTVAGTTLTFVGMTPDHDYQRPNLTVFKAAA